EEKIVHGAIFGASGFRPFELERAGRDARGNHVAEAWRVSEILSSRALAEEGRALSHCVYSYASSVERGHASIWSLSLDGPKVLTIEVRNQARQIVQVRGKFNRAATARELAIVAQWAGATGLQLDLGRW
ncbi:MAG TPA: PcfJ domain-containing protein, partial [Polyangiaceae bacterium]|nr:PcfJ domain-containing protein [Polyangiaceae bacterium]